MRKHIIHEGVRTGPRPGPGDWLDLGRLAQVELSSEDADHPIEAALVTDDGAGWRAARPGRQTIRLVFDQPQRIGRIHLMFEECVRERTQEFVLRWSPGHGTPHDIVRQQYHFSPPGTSRETEDYAVDLDGVAVLELYITPDIGGGDSRASLERLRLA